MYPTSSKGRNHVSSQIHATLTSVQRPAEISAKEDHPEHHKHRFLVSFMTLYQYQSAWLWNLFLFHTASTFSLEHIQPSIHLTDIKQHGKILFTFSSFFVVIISSNSVISSSTSSSSSSIKTPAFIQISKSKSVGANHEMIFQFRTRNDYRTGRGKKGSISRRKHRDSKPTIPATLSSYPTILPPLSVDS
jgi:hypothetical protein